MQSSHNSLVGICLGAMLLLAAPGSPVYGQKAAPAKSSQAQQPAAAQNDQPAPPQNGWRSSCASVSRSEPLDCTVEQRLVLANSGQLLAAVTIRIDGTTRQPALMVQLPHGLFLPDGISLRVDDAEVMKLALQTCDGAGCYAGASASKELIKAMSSGSQLKVLFRNLSKDEIQLALPLAGFSDALGRAK